MHSHWPNTCNTHTHTPCNQLQMPWAITQMKSNGKMSRKSCAKNKWKMKQQQQQKCSQQLAQQSFSSFPSIFMDLQTLRIRHIEQHAKPNCQWNCKNKTSATAAKAANSDFDMWVVSALRPDGTFWHFLFHPPVFSTCIPCTHWKCVREGILHLSWEIF